MYICSFGNRLKLMKKYRAVMIGNAISYDSALKNVHNFCSAQRIFNLSFDISSLYLSLLFIKKAL